MGAEFLSVKEFAKRAGVSPQSIYQRVGGKNEEFKAYCKTTAGKLEISSEALALYNIKEFNNVDQDSKDTASALNNEVEQSTLIKDLEEKIKEQSRQIELQQLTIEARDKELEKANAELERAWKQAEQVPALTEQFATLAGRVTDITERVAQLVDQQQKLTAALNAPQVYDNPTDVEDTAEEAKEETPAEEPAKEEPAAPVAEDVPPAQEKKPSLWARLFGKS